ncbi:MAG: OmpA family protein [Flavobacteriales bacterium]
MLIRATLFGFLIAASSWLQAQSLVQVKDVPFDKFHIADAVQLKQALSAIKKADALAIKGGIDHGAAMAAYQEAQGINPNNAELNMKMGVCQLNGPAPSYALAYLQRASELDPFLPRIHFLLGYALQLNAKWDEAVVEFQRHGEIIRRTPDPDRTYNMVDKHIAECNYGRSYMNTPTEARVENLGAAINTTGSEYGAVLDGKGNMYFTSRRANSTGGKINRVNNSWFEDIYHSRWQASGWSKPEPVAGALNSARNDATVSMRADGQRMIIYRDEKNGGDLYVSERSGDTWSAPVPLPPSVNSIAQESSAWTSGDGRWLYFVSSREGGLGGSDIYRSPWDETAGDWGASENLGPDINTSYDEEGVFAPGDGSTIFFASQGHTSMGGYDLFKSTETNGRWSKPENLGWPINSPGDDQFLILNAEGTTGYFNSVRPGGMGEDDIYRVDLPVRGRVQEAAMLVSAAGGVPMTQDDELVRLVGFIKGLKMMEPIDATIELMSLQEPAYIATFKTDPVTGKYTAMVPAGKDYAIQVNADGYMLHSERMEHVDGEVRMDMKMSPIAKGNAEVMRNILFEPDSYKLDASSTIELEQLAEFLKANPDTRIEVGGHTDSDVGPIPNQELSEARAHVVVNWLVEHGIPPDRLEAKGYGADAPIVPKASSSEEKALNRRTEIRVL